MNIVELKKLIIRPVITEKATLLKENENKYVFKVALSATKGQIKEALEAIYDVEVVTVNVMNVRGKKKRVRYVEGRTPRSKKAIVKLKDGQTLPFFESV